MTFYILGQALVSPSLIPRPTLREGLGTRLGEPHEVCHYYICATSVCEFLGSLQVFFQLSMYTTICSVECMVYVCSTGKLPVDTGLGGHHNIQSCSMSKFLLLTRSSP